MLNSGGDRITRAGSGLHGNSSNTDPENVIDRAICLLGSFTWEWRKIILKQHI